LSIKKIGLFFVSWFNQFYLLLSSFTKTERGDNNSVVASRNLDNIVAMVEKNKGADKETLGPVVAKSPVKENTKLMKKNNVARIAIKKNRNINVSSNNSEDLNLENLIEEILVFYGYPHNSESCYSESEKIMWAFAYFAAKISLPSCAYLWKEKYRSQPVSELVPILCEQFFNDMGHHIIPTEKDLKNKDTMNKLKSGAIAHEQTSESKDRNENTGLELKGFEKKS